MLLRVTEPAAPTDGGQSPARRLAAIAIALAAASAVAIIPSGLHRIEGFGHRPAYAAAGAVLMAILWFTEAIPIAWTALLPLLLWPLFGVFGKGPGGDTLRAAEPFVDAYIFLFLGGMTLGAAMELWGLHRRVALHIMRLIGTEPRRLLLGMLVATAVVSMWISNTATAVMMVPIGVALLKELEATQGGKRLGAFGAALMLAVAYAANIGGMATKIGTATNSIFAGYFSEKLERDIGFLEFMALGFPLVAILIPIAWLLLWRLARHDRLAGTQAREVLDRELSRMGALRGRERLVAAVFGGAAVLWIFGEPLHDLLQPLLSPVFGGKFLPKHYEATVSMTAALVLVLARAVTVASLRRVPWSALILLGGSFALAAGIEGSGLSTWMAARLHVVNELSGFAQVALASFTTIALSAFASNTASVNVMLNILPQTPAVLGTAAFAASCDFALPAGTPPNAIVFGSGYIRLPVMMRAGVVLDLIAASLLAVYGHFWIRWIL